jgi:FtsP/CotA-like multicopper oxidase with cupredoxin domain
MYHCHVEDVEHVHMGMTGLVFVHAKQDGQSIGGFTKFAYNDGDGSTGYNREYSMFLSEVWAEAHWADAHIQLPEWSDYHPDFSLLNGRVYPDTIEANAPLAPKNWGTAAPSYLPVATDVDGNLVPPAGRPDLQYQPLSSLVNCNAGERVLLRFANLGFKESAMTRAGIKLRVVGRDATPMRGLDAAGNRVGADTSYETNTLNIGPGESYDAIFTAPPHVGPGYDTYLLYNRNYKRSDNLTHSLGGQATEIRVHAAGTIPAQTMPNQDL